MFFASYLDSGITVTLVPQGDVWQLTQHETYSSSSVFEGICAGGSSDTGADDILRRVPLHPRSRMTSIQERNETSQPFHHGTT